MAGLLIRFFMTTETTHFHRRTIQEAFEKYHADNPRIYELFKRFALQIVEKRKNRPNKKTSANLLINRIRWEIYVETITDDGFRINDHYSSRYARKFVEEYPQYRDLFNFRELRSE